MISTSEPYSPTARAKLSATPETIAGVRLGSTIRRSTVSGRAPSEAAASSIEVSSSSSTGCTERDDERQRHEQQRERDRRRA